MKKNNEENINIEIDYDSFTIDEVVTIVEFFNKVSVFQDGRMKDIELYEAYLQYKKILNSLSFEKRYDKMYEEKTGVSIYKTIKGIKERLNK